ARRVRCATRELSAAPAADSRILACSHHPPGVLTIGGLSHNATLGAGRNPRPAVSVARPREPATPGLTATGGPGDRPGPTVTVRMEEGARADEGCARLPGRGARVCLRTL